MEISCRQTGGCAAVRDPLWKHVYFDKPLAEAMDTPDFIRLTRILQLGPAVLVYPGATHTRAAHSIGVYAVASRLLDVLCMRGADEWTTVPGRMSFRAAALFHDIGHFPYTHSLKELPLAEHERLSAQAVLRDPLYSCAARAGAVPEQVAAIIDGSIGTTDTETLFFRKLLSGVLDPDKLDYLNRDAYYCGVPYGVQDTDYILSRLQPDREKGLVLSSNALPAVEDLLFSKYLMYRSVYWHRHVRIATALMKKALYGALVRGLVSADELYGLDDGSVFQTLDRSARGGRFPEYICAESVRSHRLYDIVCEIPFDPSRDSHRQLESLEGRSAKEHEAAQRLGVGFEDVVIDVPERISFESSLWIEDEQVSFSDSSTVFSSVTVRSFTGSLRKIRVAVRGGAAGGVWESIVADFI